MINSVEVLVKNKETGDTRTISYKSFLETAYMFDLIGQCDEKGNLIEGDPNLESRHQKTARVKSVAVHAGESGIRVEPVLVKEAEVKTEVKEEDKQAEQPEDLPKVKNKPGPKPKTQLA